MNQLTCVVAAVITDGSGRVLLCQQRQRHRRWALPGGRTTRAESPVLAVLREIRVETGLEPDIVDLVGIYHLGGDAPVHRGGAGPTATGPTVPEVLVYVFRGRLSGPLPPADLPERDCRLVWHDPARPPEPMTPITRRALVDAVAGRSGVLRQVPRDTGVRASVRAAPARVPAPAAPADGG